MSAKAYRTREVTALMTKILWKIIREYKYLTYVADEGSNERPWSCWLRNLEFCKSNGFIIQQVQYWNDVGNMEIVGDK